MNSLKQRKLANTIIAGPTYSGKTEMIHSLLLSMMINNSSDDLSIYIADSAISSYEKYTNISHVKDNVSGSDDTETMLNKLVHIMNKRYKELEENKSLNSIDHKIVIVIDEYAVLSKLVNFNSMNRMLTKEITQLAKSGPKVGMYLVVAVPILTEGLILSETLSYFSRRVLKGDISRLCLSGDDVASFIGEIKDVNSAILIEDGLVKTIRTEYIPAPERLEIINKLASNNPLRKLSLKSTKKASIAASLEDQLKRLLGENKLD